MRLASASARKLSALTTCNRHNPATRITSTSAIRYCAAESLPGAIFSALPLAPISGCSGWVANSMRASSVRLLFRWFQVRRVSRLLGTFEAIEQKKDRDGHHGIHYGADQLMQPQDMK